ncbi:undecaprenyl-diphosphatase UppP [candidate division KSB3 bacterium]|uniref:Undecaprenyl-diphosphatase n=1 Tax=candidate division KSB3 bacterium TaxID=2044937 RepID=A0A2G6KKJ7_9BACT|nr:MAG: undecaprenyl-diphosphatase UppP [candidate division KSB3 bacterium]
MRDIILGIIQGLTEFLPVSSSGHLAIVQQFYQGMSETDILLDILLHVGTLFVVFMYYRKDLVTLCQAALSYGPGGQSSAPSRHLDNENFQQTQDRRMILLIIIGSVPTAIIGVLLKPLIEASFSSLTMVGTALIITGTVLYITDKIKRTAPSRETLSYTDAFIIGIVQGLAIFPGISRSGSTISTGILLGIERKLAAKFSFLLSIPAILGAVVLEGKDLADLAQTPQLLPYILATIVAFVTGYFAIAALIRVVVNKQLSWFSWYCWALGGVALVVGLFA